MAHCARRPRPKSVTFTGCWTCRSRKVKCDERETNGCGVCERAGLSCAGFEVSLCWLRPGQRQQSSSAPSGGGGTRRRGMKLHRPVGPIMTEDEIMRALSMIDATLQSEATRTVGPFAVFQADGFSEGRSMPCTDGALPEVRHLPISTDAESETSATPGVGVEVANLTADVAGEREDRENAPSSAAAGIDGERGTDPDLVRVLSPRFGLAMPLFRDGQTARLMHHFANHVAELLQPVVHPRNPWRTTYFSFALQGCPDLWLAQTTTSAAATSDAALSLFHSLLSAAAFHLRNATDGSADYHRLALHHRIKALQALHVASPHPSNEQLYLVHLTAMLSLVTVDTMAGEDSDFPVHLRACYQLEKPPSRTSSAGSMPDGAVGAASPVYSICRFLTLLARTTSPVIMARPWRRTDDGAAAFTGPSFDRNERSVEYMYGITPALGNMLSKTCKMAEHLAYYHQQREDLPQPLQTACTALGHEIAAWAADDEPFVLIAADEHSMRQIARCQAHAFHGAVLIYYSQTLQKYGLRDRMSPVAVNVHAHVRAIWAQLTAAEDLKDSYTGGLKRSAPMSWPAFLAACESSPYGRDIWVQWWQRVNSYRIGNFARQWQIIQDVWDMQDAVEESSHTRISWRDALARIGKLVLPI